MTPPATAAARSHAPRPARTAPSRSARRVSGPARTPPRGPVGSARGVAPAPSLGLALARRVAALPDARLLDRLARGRLWIALLAVGLVGVVFLQISLLKLNTGISRGVQTAQTLERQNTELKFELSRLGGGERVQDSAAAMGFVLPATGQPEFLDAAGVSAVRAAANVTPPAPIQQLPLGMIPTAEGGTAGTTSDPVLAAGSVPAGSAVAPVASGASAASTGATAPADPGTPSAPPGVAPAPTAPQGVTHVAPAPENHTPAVPPSAAVTTGSPTAGGATAAPGG